MPAQKFYPWEEAKSDYVLASSQEQIDLCGPLAEWLNVRGCNPRYPGSIPGRASNFPSIEGLSRRL